MAAPAPGWFPDPFDPTRLRWWDGRQWTTELHPDVRRPGLTETAPPPPAQTRRRTRGATVALVTAGVLLVAGATATAGGVLALATTPPATSTEAGGAASAPEPGVEESAASAGPSVSTTPSATATSRATAAPKPTPAEQPAGAAAAAAALVRVASVTDGDTIRVRLGGTTERVRVIGIDTPELSGDECYAQEAASRMQGLVQGRQVRLVRDPTQADRDRHGRLLRHVALADGRQVAKILIAGGFGEEYTYDEPYAGRAAYRAAEQAAREAGRGIWSSGCRARAHAAAPVAPTQCVLKGNNADDGERRWFCTERQARDAGRRASKV